MPAPRPNRRLAAVLAADVVGYSRLMERDEPGTLDRLRAHRQELVGPLLAEHRGRLVKLMGDGILCEFGSVVDAVGCAVAIQRGMAERERGVPDDRRVRLRVGVNLGDIIVEDDDDIYGEGVNVAARLESLAEPGGVCVSGKVRDETRRRLDLEFAPMGARRVKSLEEPVHAWRVVLDCGGTGAPATVAAARSRPATATPPADGRLPPLDALRTLEAAARHSSFARAAEELHVSPAAADRRVGTLEAGLGVLLLRRSGDRLEPTGEGEVLAAAVRRGLDEMARGVAAALGRGDGAAIGPLRISVLPSFAMRWLVPRLADFGDRHPGVETRILAESGAADLRGGAADVALRFGRGPYPGLRAEFLMADSVLPVCSPTLLAGRGPVDRADAVLRLPLLHDSTAAADGSGADWPSWLAHVGRPDLPCEAGQSVNSAVLAIEAAAAGMGVALARTSLLSGDLASGRLVAPLPRAAAPTTFSYWLVCLPEVYDAPRVAAFRAWIAEEARSFRRAASAGEGWAGLA